MFCVRAQGWRVGQRQERKRWEKEEFLHPGKAADFASIRGTWGGKFSVAFALGLIILKQLLTPTLWECYSALKVKYLTNKVVPWVPCHAGCFCSSFYLEGTTEKNYFCWNIEQCRMRIFSFIYQMFMEHLLCSWLWWALELQRKRSHSPYL